MSGKIKGITLEIGGETTGLKKALSNVNKETNSIQKELKEVEKALKLDPKNTELLAQKQKLLSDNVAITEKKLKSLKDAKAKADKEMAEGTEYNEKQYRELQREIVLTENKLKGLTDETSKNKKESKGLGEILKNKVVLGWSAAVATAGALISKLSQLEEETREYREDLIKLETAYKSTNKTAESAKQIYSGFFKILGESDRAVEAANHLAELTKNEKDLIKWETIAAGINAKFTDSLPIEGLTEAANETAKVGKVTGVLADALNWVSKDSKIFSEVLSGNKSALTAYNNAIKEGANVEDAFSEALSKMTSEEERSTAITETLHQMYSGLGEEYLKNNEAVIKNREAQQKWNDAVAKGAEIIAPIKAAVVSWGADVLSGAVAVITGKNATDEFVKSVNKEIKAHQEAKITQEEKTAAAVAEIDYTARLYKELETLTDETGKINEADKVRVNYILGELNEALGLQLKLTGDQISGYKELGASIEQLLEKKRAEIILASQEESYKTAIANIDAKKVEQDKLRIEIIEKELQLQNMQAKFNETHSTEMAKAISLEQGKLSELASTYAENDKVINDYYADITSYENNYKAIMSGNADAIKAVNNSVGESFKIAGEATDKELAKQVYSAAKNYAETQKKVDEGLEGITQEMADSALEQYKLACTEYEKIGKAIPDGLQVGVENEKPVLKSKLATFIADVKSWFTGPDAFDTHSPSKWSEKIGEWVDEGLINGVVAKQALVKKTFAELFGVIEEEHEKLTAEEEQYNSELERIRAAGTEKANQSYLESLKKTAENAKKQREEIRKCFEGILSDTQKAIDDLDKEMDSYKKGLSSTDLTQTVTRKFINKEGKEETSSQYVTLADLSGKRRELEQFKENIINLKTIGIDETMIEQIQELGGEKGGMLAEALLKATPEQREAFIDDFKAIGALAGETTSEVFGDKISGVAGEVKTALENLNPDLLKIGEDWGTILGKGLISKLNEMLKSMDTVSQISTSGGVVSDGTSPGTTVINNNITQNIGTATSESAYESAKETERVLNNIANTAVLT